VSDRVWRLPELQAEAARLAWPAQAAQVLTAWNSADHSAELGRYYTRLVAAGAWHQCLDLVAVGVRGGAPAGADGRGDG